MATIANPFPETGNESFFGIKSLGLSHAVATRLGVAAVLFLLLGTLAHAAAEKFTWKPITDAVLRIDDRAPKQWGLYHTGKKYDPLLLQLGTRVLVIYIRNQAVYEIAPTKLERKGEDLVWREADKAEKPLATSDWSTRDIGSAWRVRVKLTEEGRLVDIQIPQMPDLRGLY